MPASTETGLVPGECEADEREVRVAGVELHVAVPELALFVVLHLVTRNRDRVQGRIDFVQGQAAT